MAQIRPPTGSAPLTRIPRPTALILLFLLLASGTTSGAAGQEVATRSAHAALQEDILALIRSPGWRSSDWGVLAVSLEYGDTLVSFGSDTPLTPASNQKLFTSATALHYLGPDYRFPTYLLTDGEVRDGVLEGRLILYGTGDPAISDRVLGSPMAPFRAFAQALAEMGIHTVAGEILGDGSFFEGPTRRESWGANNFDAWYGAPVSALTFQENVVTLRIRGGTAGMPPEVRTVPEGAALPIRNAGMTVTGPSRSPFQIVRDDPDGPIELRGQLAVGAPEVWRAITVSDPALFAVSVLRQVLEAEGIQVVGGARSLAPGEPSPLTSGRTIAPAFAAAAAPLRTIAVHRSPPLSELLHVMNKVSHNLYSELFLFAVGRITRGSGSFDVGSSAMEDFLERVVGIPGEGLHIEDGSGLSRMNRATPDAFVRLLTYVAGFEHAEIFWGSLPEAGNRRELGRMYNSPAAGNLRAKTGTINWVSALSGVVRGVEGEPILFSILSNNVPSTSSAKGVEDRIGIRLANFSRSGAPSPVEGTLARVVEYGAFGPRLAEAGSVEAR